MRRTLSGGGVSAGGCRPCRASSGKRWRRRCRARETGFLVRGEPVDHRHARPGSELQFPRMMFWMRSKVSRPNTDLTRPRCGAAPPNTISVVVFGGEQLRLEQRLYLSIFRRRDLGFDAGGCVERPARCGCGGQRRNRGGAARWQPAVSAEGVGGAGARRCGNGRPRRRQRRQPPRRSGGQRKTECRARRQNR